MRWQALKRWISPPTMLFHRQYGGYTGGHQKVADYFAHTRASGLFKPSIFFTQDSQWDACNPWLTERRLIAQVFQPMAHSALFLAGLDWLAYEQAGMSANKPVINLIQHVRHADPKSDVYPFLGHRAVRIAVSQQVADAISDTGQVNGPVFTIANGIDIPHITTPKTLTLLVVGYKRPELAKALRTELVQGCLSGPEWSRAHRYRVLEAQVPRQELLELMAQAEITLLLPNITEGFYLPALEAMKLSDIAIVPDCVGNRGFCVDQQNCLMPMADLEGLVESVFKAAALLKTEAQQKLKQRAQVTLAKHTLAQERQAYRVILEDLSAIW